MAAQRDDVPTSTNWPSVPAMSDDIADRLEELRTSLQMNEAAPRTFPAAPVSAIQAIESSSRKQEVFDLLLSGWSPAKISKTLFKQYGELLPPHEIAAFLEEIPVSLLLPPSYLQRRLKQVDITFDAVGELGRLLRLQSERLDASLMLEEVTQQPQPTTDKQARVYWQMLLDYIEKLQSLGDLPKAAAKLEVTPHEAVAAPRLRDLLEAGEAGAAETAGGANGGDIDMSDLDQIPDFPVLPAAEPDSERELLGLSVDSDESDDEYPDAHA